MPRVTNKPTENTTSNPPVAAGTPCYGLRGVHYKYSHSKPPHVAPPDPPTERPAVPQSIARKGKNRTTATRAAPADTGINQVERQVSQDEQAEPEPERRDSEPEPERQVALRAQDSNLPQASTSTSAGAHAENMPSTLNSIPENAPVVTEEISTPGIEASQQLGTTFSNRDTQAYNHISLAVPLGNPLCTPRRSGSAVSFTSPTVLIFGTPPSWARFDQDNSQIPPFVPNTSIPLDMGVFSTSSPPGLSRYSNSLDSGSSSLAFRATEFADPQSGSALNTQPCNASTLAEDVFQPQPTLAGAAPAPAADLNTLYATIMKTIPPILPVAPMALVPTRSSGSAPFRFPSESSSDVTSREGSASRDDLVPAQVLPVSRNTSLGPVTTNEQDILWHSSVVPSSHRLCHAHLPARRTRMPQDPQRSMMYLRQSDFTYDQVTFIKHMKHRWCFYLATQDPFPINVLPAQELCMSYAEKILQASRTDYNITRNAFDYVRKKDSNIRNTFLCGLLTVVEEAHDVTRASEAKIDELINNMNFAHTSYDLATKKVIGRYRHPCIAKVINIILFTKRSQGRPVGVRFIRELIGDTGTESARDTGTEPAQDPPGLAANAGAPVATIAFACTLIIYAFHSIKAGDSSNRKSKTVKPVKLTEGKYGGHYRKILAKLKQYPRLGEVRKAYMEEIMREYLACHITTGVESDEELEFDDEMMSDGE